MKLNSNSYNTLALCILLYFVLFFLFFMVSNMILALFIESATLDTRSVLFQSLCYGQTLLSVIGASFLMLKFQRQRAISSLGLSLKGYWQNFFWGALTVFTFYIIGFLFLYTFDFLTIVSVHPFSMSLLYSFVVFTLVALSEEIMIRGYVLGQMLRFGLNRYHALALSSLIFSLLHFFNPNIGVLPLLNLFLAGVMLGSTYIFTKNLWFPIGLHLFWNFVQGPLLGFKVSGIDFGYTILEIKLSDNPLINGGEFGYEGSLVCTVMMLIFTLSICYLGERRLKKVAQ